MTFWVAGATVGAAVIGGAVASNSASKTSKAQQESAREANATQMYMFDQARDDQEPWMQAGGAALNQLSGRLGIKTERRIDYNGSPTQAVLDIYRKHFGRDPNADTLANWLKQVSSGDKTLADVERIVSSGQGAQLAAMSGKNKLYQTSADLGGGQVGDLMRNFTMADFQKDPGYGFRQAEGMKGVTNSAAARGGLLSGAALRAASQYNQNFASNEFGNAYNRFNTNQDNQFNRLASIAGVGQKATAQVGQNAMTTGQVMGSNITGAGNARASGYLAQGNALSGAINQGVSAFNGWNQMQGQASAPGAPFQPTSAWINNNGGGF